MKNVPRKKGWNNGEIKIHVDAPPITWVKINNDEKPDKYSVKIKLRRDPTSEKSDLHKLKMDLLYNGDPEEALLFIWNFQMILEVSGTLAESAKIHNICTLLHGKALCQLDTLSVEWESTTVTNLNHNILVLGT